MKWNNLQTLPENGKHVWVLNSEYCTTFSYPFKRRNFLVLREGAFNLGSGWDLGKDIIANVIFWTDPTPVNELPEIWPSEMAGDNCKLKYIVDCSKQE